MKEKPCFSSLTQKEIAKVQPTVLLTPSRPVSPTGGGMDGQPLRILAGLDAEMMSKEVVFSRRKMSGRLSATHEVADSMDETQSATLAFFAQESGGRQGTQAKES